MANNTHVNKVVYNDSTLIDLTEDTVTSESLLSGYTAHDRSGAPINGAAVIPTKISDLQDDVGYLVGTDIVNSLTSGEAMPPSAGCVYDAVNSAPTSVVSTLNRRAFGRIALISGEFVGNGTSSQSTGLTGWVGVVNVRNKATGEMLIYLHSNANGEILGWDGSTNRTFTSGTTYQVSGVLYLA